MSENSLVSTRERAQILISEIRQVQEQYKKEVPKKRGPWPESIRTRIQELWRLGMSSHQIAEEAGLPVQTMYSWRQRIKKEAAEFVPVPVVKRRRRSKFDLQLSQSQTADKNPTVTVVTSDGIRIEGVPVGAAARLVRDLS
jgi:hypothetical protein